MIFSAGHCPEYRRDQHNTDHITLRQHSFPFLGSLEVKLILENISSVTFCLQILLDSEATEQERPGPEAPHRPIAHLALDVLGGGCQPHLPRLHRRARRLARLPFSSSLRRSRPSRLVLLLQQHQTISRCRERRRRNCRE